MRSDLTWQDCRPSLSEEAIGSVEERLNVRLPADYVECVIQCDGGWPNPHHFSYPDPSLGAVETSLGRFLSLDSSKAGSLLDVVDWLSDQLPSGVVPFADEPGGDFICFDFRTSATPSVVYWMHERNGDEAIAQLAPNFSAFLDQLRQAVTCGRGPAAVE